MAEKTVTPATKSPGKAATRTRNNKAATKTSGGATRRRKTKVKAAVSVIIPVLNMENSIKTMCDDAIAGLEAFGKPYEILFVDDASTDATWQTLDAIARERKNVKLIRMRNTFGESCAFDAGLKHVQGEYIVYAAARVRANLRDIAKLLQRLEEGEDLVVGWRWPRKDSALNQRVSSWFNRIVKKLAHISLHDINSSVFAARKSALESITVYGDLNIFIPILAARKGFKVGEEKIEQMAGEFRQSRYVSDYIHRALDIITVIFLTKYSKKPLHFLGFFGMIFTLAGVLMNLYLFIYRLFEFGAIAGRPLLLLGALLLIIGLQMISIGLIGEMIIYTHAREIEEYNIETVVGA